MSRYRVLVAVAIFATSAVGAWAQKNVNPHFDTDLSGWTVFLAPQHEWSSVDADASVGSGSLLAFNDVAGGALVRATQCVAVEPGMTLHFMVRTLVLDSGDSANITLDLTPHADDSCHTPIGLNRVIETPPKGQWTRIIHGPHTVPEGVQSIEVGLGLSEALMGTVPVSAHFDDAQFFLFANGFESATCGDWSDAVPFCETPEVGLRVEVSWETPSDPDPGDEIGTDLDLHLLHPDGSGAWLGAFDCFQANPSPDWGAAGAPQNPDLVREDSDGAGPEIIQVTDPQSVSYDFGVPYVDDLGFGASGATVTVFVDGSIVYQFADKTLVAGEFWHIGSVEWPGGIVTVVDSVTQGVP
jgi:hypothetical protein